MTDREKVYCVNCIYFIQHVHPFYPDELMQACLCNPNLKSNYMNRKVEYADPAEKNKLNDCSEFNARMSVKIKTFFKKLFKIDI